MRSVLLVDDSPLTLRVLARRLAAEGFEVREASSLEIASRVEVATLTCAILDVELADGDGTELASVLRAKRTALPVAFFTTGASSSLMEVARQLGPVFVKPDVDPLVAWAVRTGATP